jgi:hypothetical protein
MGASCAENRCECDQQFSGAYVWGHEVHTFQSCDQSEIHWVSASGWVIADLLQHYESFPGEPYEPLYITFRGHILDEEVDGFASDYAGLIRISEVLDWSATVPSACGLE